MTQPIAVVVSKHECDDQLGISCLSVGCTAILFCRDKCPYSGNSELILILLLFYCISSRIDPMIKLFKEVAESIVYKTGF
jgi:hypothetical protein